jgi:hypothetical protein
VEICARVYRPRQPRESPLFRLVSQHIDELLRAWPERFERTLGPLRPVVEPVLRDFLTCGLPEHGFARCWCPTCRLSYLVPSSCRVRSFCPSCEKKRSLLWAEWLREEVLDPVPHRHLVLTIPRVLRPLFRRRRELLLELAQCAAEAVSELMRRALGAEARPGIVGGTSPRRRQLLGDRRAPLTQRPAAKGAKGRRAARAPDTCRPAAVGSLLNTAGGGPAMRDPSNNVLRRLARGLAALGPALVPLAAALRGARRAEPSSPA